MCSKLYGAEFQNYMSVIEGEYGHIEQALEENRQTLIDLRQTNDSLLSTKTNSTMQRLTIVNVIMLPLGLVSWIFAMDSKYLSLNTPLQLGLVFASMAFIGIFQVAYFRSKKWL
jgi:Mg2+ and Co2+ transporter CorA